MRRTAVVVVSLLATATLSPVAAGQASVPAERAARITLSAPATVAPHSAVTLRGRTGARRGAKVKIYQRPVDRSTWNLEGTTRVKKRGKFRYTEGVTDFSRYYRACVGRSCSAQRLVTVGVVTPPPPPPPPTPTAATLTLTSGAAAEIEAGQSITVAGTASPNLIGKVVALQSYDGTSKTWGSLGTTVVDAAATWSLTGPIGTAGKIGVRVYAPPTATTLETAVGAGIINVYGWYYFTDEDDQPYAVTGDYDFYGPNTINGVPYAHSLYFSRAYTSMTDEWNLNRSCKTFAATVGLSDYADASSRYSSQIYSDAVKKWTQSGFALGQSTPISVDITGALRLRIDAQRDTGDYASLIFADARALCSF